MPARNLTRFLSGRSYVCPKCSITAQIRRRALHASRPSQQSVLSLLEQRGLVNQIAGDRNALDKLLSTRKVGFYAGIDPTAPSLHLGHLLPLMVLFWLYHHGHHVVSLVGGATAKVGDPSGRLVSRAKTAEAVTQKNFEAMFKQVGRIWERVERRGFVGDDMVGKRELLNNAEWLNELGILRFLKMMGNGMRVGAMLGRDTVRNKMENGDGMSFSEFTYPLLQAWDWWQMFHDRGIQIQIGGSDQYGNIVAGIDGVKYIAQTDIESSGSQWLDAEGRLKDEHTPMGLTVPLLTTSSGEKFGKSAGNAIWLDAELTSPFDLYGFLLRSGDDDVERYLKLFTFVPLADISKTMTEHRADPSKRKAQHLLASEVIELAHGPEEATRTQNAHRAMRNPTLGSLTQKSSDTETNTTTTKLPKSLVHKTPFSRILYHAGLVPTKSEGARLITKGGAYIALASTQNEIEALDFVPINSQQPHEVETLVEDGILILRLGKWKVRVIEVVEDSHFDSTGEVAPGWAEYKETLGR